MNLNKRGVSIVELVVSVALVSVIMLFMYRLISDVTYAKDNDELASLNQEQRVIMISKIEEIIRNDARINNIVTNDLEILFRSATNIIYSLSCDVVVEIEPTCILYKGNTHNNPIEKWKIRGSGIKTGKPVCQNNSLEDITLYQCNIPFYTNSQVNNSENNNTLDDITLSFMFNKYGLSALQSTDSDDHVDPVEAKEYVTITVNVTFDGGECAAPKVILGTNEAVGSTVTFEVEKSDISMSLKVDCGDDFHSIDASITPNKTKETTITLYPKKVKVKFDIENVSPSDNPSLKLYDSDGLAIEYGEFLGYLAIDQKEIEVNKGETIEYRYTCSKCREKSLKKACDSDTTIKLDFAKINPGYWFDTNVYDKNSAPNSVTTNLSSFDHKVFVYYGESPGDNGGNVENYKHFIGFFDRYGDPVGFSSLDIRNLFSNESYFQDNAYNFIIYRIADPYCNEKNMTCSGFTGGGISCSGFIRDVNIIAALNFTEGYFKISYAEYNYLVGGYTIKETVYLDKDGNAWASYS